MASNSNEPMVWHPGYSPGCCICADMAGFRQEESYDFDDSIESIELVEDMLKRFAESISSGATFDEGEVSSEECDSCGCTKLGMRYVAHFEVKRKGRLDRMDGRPLHSECFHVALCAKCLETAS